MTEREVKAWQIVINKKIQKEKNGLWLVPSQRADNVIYRVDFCAPTPVCVCPDFQFWQKACKHIFATRIMIERESTTIKKGSNGDTTTVTEKVRVTYGQEWAAYNAAQTQEKALFLKLLHDLCADVADPVQTKGRPRLSLGDMIFSATYKVYSTVSSRRFISDLTDAHGKGFVSKVPHFNSIFNYLESPTLTPILHDLIGRSALPLRAIETDFAVDSSGFSTCQYVRWIDAKYGKVVDKHDWIKMHLMTGVKTNVVSSVEITGRYNGDSVELPALVKATAKNFNVKEVSADKGYSGAEQPQRYRQVGGDSLHCV